MTGTVILALLVGAIFGYILRRDLLLRTGAAVGRANIAVAATLRVYAERLRQPDCLHEEVSRFADHLDKLADALTTSGENLGGKP